MTAARLTRIVRHRLAAVFRPRAVERDIDRELALHFEELIREHRASGLTEEDARREAHRAFGTFGRVREQSRDARGLTAIAGAVDDMRYGLRLLRRTPAFTTISGLALAIGIGATAATAAATVFVLARPLPFPDGDRLIRIRTEAVENAVFSRAASLHQYRAWQARARTIEAIGGSRGGNFVIAGDGAAPERVQGHAFTPSLFALLGVRPSAGRLFEPTANPFDQRAMVAVISHRLSVRRFGSAAAAVGRRIQVDAALREIIGVMPEAFRLQADSVDLWIPFTIGPAGSHQPAQDAPQIQVTARLRPDVSLEDARAELEAIARELHPQDTPPSIDVLSLREALYGWTRARLVTLGAMAVLLLALACANTAALLLARGALRRRELVTRSALGAPRHRLIRQLLTENLTLGVCASAPSVLVTWTGMRAVSSSLGPPPGLPYLAGLTLDGWALAILVALCALVPLVFGALPAAAASRIDGPGVERRGDRGLPPARASWRAALVAAQIGLAEVLLVTAALFTISYVRVAGRQLNFEPRGLLSFSYALRAADVIRPLPPDGARPAFAIDRGGALTYADFIGRLRAIPGSGLVGGLSYPPTNALVTPVATLRPVDRAGGAAGSATAATYSLATPGLFAALMTPVLEGREFDDRDGPGAPPTIVINRAAAALCCPAGALGTHLRLEIGDDTGPREVVGVVANIPGRLEQPDATPIAYIPYLQHPLHYRGNAAGMFNSMTFVLRPDGDAASVLKGARAAAAALTPGRPIDGVGTVQAHLQARLNQRRNYVMILDVFALLATLLAIFGVHSVMTHAVVERSDEIAVRKAFGARRREILILVVRPSLAIAATGIAFGVAVSLASSRVLRPQLWGVPPHDLATFAAVSVCLVAAAALGTAAAARRALAVDPSVRLRSE